MGHNVDGCHGYNSGGPPGTWPLVVQRKRLHAKLRILLCDMDRPAFSKTDVGKTVSTTGDDVCFDGKVRKVDWGDAEHTDLMGTIASVKDYYGGEVELEDGQKFQNGVDRQSNQNFKVAIAALEELIQSELPP